jgi:hypothetical protein
MMASIAAATTKPCAIVAIYAGTITCCEAATFSTINCAYNPRLLTTADL